MQSCSATVPRSLPQETRLICSHRKDRSVFELPLGHWNVPIFLVKEQEKSSPLVDLPHKPETTLGMAELLQLCTAIVHCETILSVIAIFRQQPHTLPLADNTGGRALNLVQSSSGSFHHVAHSFLLHDIVPPRVPSAYLSHVEQKNYPPGFFRQQPVMGTIYETW